MDMDMVFEATSPGDCPQTDAAQCVGEKLWRCTAPGTRHTGQWSPPVEARPQPAPSQLTAYINTGNILRWTIVLEKVPSEGS